MVDDVYVQIGLVMLIGLSAKNSILIVEFAEQQIEHGKTVIEAAIVAAELRLRPILMTSIAFILGVLPLYFATGAGALGRHSVGTAIVGGMVLSTVLNLFFIPVLYVVVKSLPQQILPQSEALDRQDRVATTTTHPLSFLLVIPHREGPDFRGPVFRAIMPHGETNHCVQ